MTADRKAAERVAQDVADNLPDDPLASRWRKAIADALMDWGKERDEQIAKLEAERDAAREELRNSQNELSKLAMVETEKHNRAERAEAEVERLRSVVGENYNKCRLIGREEADELLERGRGYIGIPHEECIESIRAALALEPAQHGEHDAS